MDKDRDEIRTRSQGERPDVGNQDSPPPMQELIQEIRTLSLVKMFGKVYLDNPPAGPFAFIIPIWPRITPANDPFKACPDCLHPIHSAVLPCPDCGHVWHPEDYPNLTYSVVRKGNKW